MDNCEGLIDTTGGYALCVTCKKSVCGKCGSTDPRHKNVECEYFEDFKNSIHNYDKLIETAKSFVEKEWSRTTDLNPVFNLVSNDYILKSDSSIRKQFDSALQHFKVTNLTESGFFAYHGSGETVIKDICRDGFDPSRRSGQVHGRGEYFGITADISHVYCRQGNLMIIAFILKNQHVKTVNNFCYIVDNPINKSMCYSIPVLIVNFNKTVTFSFERELEYENIKVEINENPLKRSYICFKWQLDNGSFELFSDSNIQLLERQYVKYFNSGKRDYNTTVLTITRYLDDLPQEYTFDFEKWMQINNKSGFERRIKRDDLSLNHRDYVWQYQDNGWTNFDILWQTKLEDYFKDYATGVGSNKCHIQLAPRPETYEIDFFEMTQKNLSHGTPRAIQRTEL